MSATLWAKASLCDFVHANVPAPPCLGFEEVGAEKTFSIVGWQRTGRRKRQIHTASLDGPLIDHPKVAVIEAHGFLSKRLNDAVPLFHWLIVPPNAMTHGDVVVCRAHQIQAIGGGLSHVRVGKVGQLVVKRLQQGLTPK